MSGRAGTRALVSNIADPLPLRISVSNIRALVNLLLSPTLPCLGGVLPPGTLLAKYVSSPLWGWPAEDVTVTPVGPLLEACLSEDSRGGQGPGGYTQRNDSHFFNHTMRKRPLKQAS